MSLLSILLALTLPTGSAQSAPYRVPSDFAAKATAYMEARASARGFHGAVLVAQNGKPLVSKAYGLANREFGIPNTTSTKFRIGSVTKQFTAAAILYLEKQGKLQVGDKVSTYLPDWPKPWDAMTVHHLLSHTGGFPALKFNVVSNVSGLSRPVWLPRYDKISDYLGPGEELLPPDFAPGEGWMYSNIGYVALGLIVEKVSGLTYSAFLTKEFFEPLEMHSTGCEEPQRLIIGRACGYALKGEVYENAPFVDLRVTGGAGAAYSTLNDLLTWDRALTTNRILSEAATAKLFTPVRSGYGYGWWVGQRMGHDEQWHRGNVNGFVAVDSRFPREDLSIIVLSNVERTSVRAIATELAAIAFEKPYEIPMERREDKIDPATFDRFLGKYHREDDPNDIFNLVRDGDRLLMEIPGASTSFRVAPMARNRLFAPTLSIESELEFVTDSSGSLSHVLCRNEGEVTKRLKD